MKKIICFLLLFAGTAHGIEFDGPSHDGHEVAVDMPQVLRLKNKVGTNRAGLCVFTSINMGANWQHVVPLEKFQEFMTHKPGGGWPDKVDTMIVACAGKDAVQYVQYTGKDPSVVQAAIASGRMPAVTYDGRDKHYGGQHIEHMVNCVGYDDKYVVILDNNYIGEKELVWLTHEEFLSRWIGQGSGRNGWMVCLLAPGAPPIPKGEDMHIVLAAAMMAGMHWETRDNGAALYDHGRQTGWYDKSSGEYHQLNGRAFGPACDPPIPLPEGAAVERTGIDGGEHFRLNGRPSTREDALKAIKAEQAKVPDDGKLPFAVCIGLATDAAKAIGDACTGKLRAVFYDAVTDPRACDRNGKPAYTPGVTLVMPDGTALGRADYSAELVEAIRALPDGYDPGKLKDLLHPTVDVQHSVDAKTLGAVAAAVVAGLVLIGAIRRK